MLDKVKNLRSQPFRVRPTFILILLMTVGIALQISNQKPVTSSQYFNKVVSIIQSRALKKSKVDWIAIKAKTSKMIAGAKTTSDTYEAIGYVLSKLGDNHSHLLDKNGQPITSFMSSIGANTPKRLASPLIIEREGRKYGYIIVTGFIGPNFGNDAKSFAGALQQRIAEATKAKPDGWIVDLREDVGGNMWPMLVGTGPLLGGGNLGYFVYPNVSVPWFYENGKSGVSNEDGNHTNFKIDNSLADLPNQPLVVLIGGATASSGEALAISFKGRPKTRFVGSDTCGLSTNNESIRLSDGATLLLTTSGEADRNKIPCDGAIAPDIKIDQGDVPLGGKNDPGIEAATAWLNSQL